MYRAHCAFLQLLLRRRITRARKLRQKNSCKTHPELPEPTLAQVTAKMARQDKEAAERATDKGTEEQDKETARNATELGAEAARMEKEKEPTVELIAGSHPVIPVQHPVIPVHPAPASSQPIKGTGRMAHQQLVTEHIVEEECMSEQ